MVWYNWTSNVTNCTSTSTTDAWYCWTEGTSTNTASTINADVWGAWVVNCTFSGTTTSTAVYRPTHVETEAERAKRVEREERYRREQAEREARAKAARERAEGLLLEHLSERQRDEYKRGKSFTVAARRSGRRYRIMCAGGIVANVHELDAHGKTSRRLCAHVSHSFGVPSPDHFLAQKLMLEHHEDEFRRVANDHGP